MIANGQLKQRGDLEKARIMYSKALAGYETVFGA
jgi:hypothetical protein